MWLARDWIFVHILRKEFESRDSLLAVWSLIAIVILFRDQFLHFLVARGRFQLTSTLTTISAIVSLSSSFALMRSIGVSGAPLGMLIGEVLNVLGIIVFSLREARRRPDPAPMTA